MYDHDSDELEWHNLASDPKHAEVKDSLKKWLPEVNAEDSVVER